MGAAESEGATGRLEEEDEGILGAADIAVVRPKKSTAGAEGLEGGTIGLGVFADVSSSETLALFFWRDGGSKNDFADGLEAKGSGTVSSSLGSGPVDAYGSEGSEDSRLNEGSSVRLLALKTSPGPPPPPRTLCFGAATGVFVFGAGSIPNSDDFPDPIRGFLVGLSSIESSSSWFGLLERAGSAIPIFFFFGGGLGCDDEATGAFGSCFLGRETTNASDSLSLPLP